MTMNDPIADFLTRIRNSNAIRQRTVNIPASRIKVNLAQVLKDEGFIDSYEVEQGSPRNNIRIRLKYGPDGEHVIRLIDRVSKPGRRVYSKAKEIPQVLKGLGIYVLSTPKGLLSDKAARAQSLGGEILCKVY